ncbi:hypothetical protein JK636_12205 [Clostridium sp. YIM B02515]|uniref:ABC transporter permease n=1 Tax=Clostridium rhizosphaerae TaxID=2803861 RepID=A0ABS1TB28_9CLOT|nr:hypothetical protein [Clostridium rhizosphaerae]MBL4936520.1 hypothetical protein [Clostridium rhizosphaerae]
MYRTFINSFKVSFAEGANQFIYFLKRIPLIGKKIPEKLYKKTDAKLTIGIISQVLGLFGGFFRKAFYIGIMVILPAYLISDSLIKDKTKLLPIFFHIFAFLSLVLGPLIKSTIINKYDKQAFNMIILMRADAREYYISSIIYINLKDFVHFVIPMLIIGSIIGFSPLKALIFIMELIALRFIGEYLHIKVYFKTKSALTEKNIYMTIVILGSILLAYLLPALELTVDFQKILFNAYIAIFVICLGAAAFIYIFNYKNYTVISKKLLTKDNLFKLGSIKTDMKFGDVKIDEKKMSKEDLDSKSFSKKEGYEYLNALFFKRHRRIMVTPIRNRSVIIGIVFLICMYFVIFMPQHREDIVSQIQKSTALFVFLMYLMSTGERICKAMFYNCDMSLLRYTYYRESKVILSNFTSRLKRVVMLNIIPAAALCLALIIIIAAAGYSSNLIAMIPVFLCILCLACFFSIHHLFMYYVIQPYTAELTVKSPLFKIINAVMYFVCYGCLQIKTSSYYFTLGVLGVTVIYMAAALVVTYKAAPKTFRLK